MNFKRYLRLFVLRFQHFHFFLPLSLSHLHVSLKAPRYKVSHTGTHANDMCDTLQHDCARAQDLLVIFTYFFYYPSRRHDGFSFNLQHCVPCTLHLFMNHICLRLLGERKEHCRFCYFRFLSRL